MQTAVAATDESRASEAADDLADQLRARLDGDPGAVVLFAAPAYDHTTLLRRLGSEFKGAVVVGASSAGEFTQDRLSEGLACALALRGDDVRFGSGVGCGVSSDVARVARQITADFSGGSHPDYPHRAALVMTDALAGHAETLVEQLTIATAGEYSFFGGGAGDNARFQKTTVFSGQDVLSDAAVALEILSTKPLGIGSSHGWDTASEPMRVTAADGASIKSLNGLPAVEAFEAHAAGTQQSFDRHNPIPFFLQNILGIRSASGHRLRVPLAVAADGAVTCASEVPQGAVVQIMRSSAPSAIEAARRAADLALVGLQGHRPAAALFFDCVATRLRLGHDFGSEIAAIKDKLPGVDFTGCNTHGQIVRADGQFQGFHNCTAVVCLFPE
jgi:hypothetical protein